MVADAFIPVFFQTITDVFAAFASVEIFTGISLLSILLMFTGLEIALWVIEYLMAGSMPSTSGSSGGGMHSEAYKPDNWDGEWRF